MISREQATEWFDLAHVGKSPSRFDLKKLENLNGHYIRAADDARLADLVADRLEFAVSDDSRELLRRAMPALKPRAANMNELTTGTAFLFRTRPLALDNDAAALLTPEARALLASAHRHLDAVQAWDTESIEDAVRRTAEDAGTSSARSRSPCARR